MYHVDVCTKHGAHFVCSLYLQSGNEQKERKQPDEGSTLVTTPDLKFLAPPQAAATTLLSTQAEKMDLEFKK